MQKTVENDNRYIDLSETAQSELGRFRELATRGGENKKVEFGLPSKDYSAAEELQNAGLMRIDTSPEGETMMYPTSGGRERILDGLVFRSRLPVREAQDMDKEQVLMVLEAASITGRLSVKGEPGIRRSLEIIGFEDKEYRIIEDRHREHPSDKYANKGTSIELRIDGKTGALLEATTANIDWIGNRTDREDESAEAALPTTNALLWELESVFREYLGKPDKLEELREQRIQDDEDDAYDRMMRQREEDDEY